jgi:hypothetical protein
VIIGDPTLFAQHLLGVALIKTDVRLTDSSGDNVGSLPGIPDSFCDRRVVRRHFVGTFIETEMRVCVMDSVSVRSYLLVSDTSLIECASPFSAHFV